MFYKESIWIKHERVIRCWNTRVYFVHPVFERYLQCQHTAMAAGEIQKIATYIILTRYIDSRLNTTESISFLWIQPVSTKGRCFKACHWDGSAWFQNRVGVCAILITLEGQTWYVYQSIFLFNFDAMQCSGVCDWNNLKFKLKESRLWLKDVHVMHLGCWMNIYVHLETTVKCIWFVDGVKKGNEGHKHIYVKAQSKLH